MAQVKQPADKSHFILPDLGEGVHEAELIKWRVSVGDQVAEHQTLAEMETDKALVEVPSPWAGVVTELCGSEGDIINVGSVLVRLGSTAVHLGSADGLFGFTRVLWALQTVRSGSIGMPMSSSRVSLGSIGVNLGSTGML